MASSLRTPIPASTQPLISRRHLHCRASFRPSHSLCNLHPCPKRSSSLFFSNRPNRGVAILRLSPFHMKPSDFCSISDNDAAANVNGQSNPDGVPVMKQGYGAFGGATLEKSKLDLSQSTTRSSPQTEDGGGGGDIGNRINHGGGDGGDDGGDDDDYFGDGDDDDEGDDGGFFQRRLVLPEIFDRKIVEAVLQEWYKTISDLPVGLKQAMELGFVSSAHMVRYISHFGRPTLTRLLSRAAPSSVSRGLIGRMIADPGFLYKMCWEQSVTVALGFWWEVKHRKEKIKDEWHLAALNVLAVCLCNAVIVWSLAPCRSYGSTFKFNLQNTIQKLPNNIFERSYAFREFDTLKRVQGLFYKAGELCLAGLLVGTAVGSITKSATCNNVNLSMPIPAVKTSALAYGAFLGLSGNLRYQFLHGAETLLQQHFNNVGIAMLSNALLRAFNIYIGDATRVSWLGLDEMPEKQIETTQKPYRRPATSENPFKNRFLQNSLSLFRFFSNQKPSTAQRKTTKHRVKRKVLVAG